MYIAPLRRSYLIWIYLTVLEECQLFPGSKYILPWLVVHVSGHVGSGYLAYVARAVKFIYIAMLFLSAFCQRTVSIPVHSVSLER